MQRNHESQKLFASRMCEIGFLNKKNCEVLTLHTHFEIHHKRVFFHKIFDDSDTKERKIKITKHNKIALLTARILKMNHVWTFNLQ